MEGEEFGGGGIVVEDVFPSGSFPGFDESGHVWVFFGSDGFKPGLVNDAGNDSFGILFIEGWLYSHYLFDGLGWYVNGAEVFAEFGTVGGAFEAVGSVFFAEAVEALLFGG
mmetsp:Transcript_13079/g.26869  ORF Transcript_13079/g.26869 Transcript_13079/m.26869 type:complete len:111 (+) Transcript_13079:1116-1448(+)